MSLYEFEGQCPLIPKSSFIHPQATIIGNVKLGEECYIGAGAVIRGDYGRIVIGNGSNIQDNCTIHVDLDTEAIIGDNVLVGHGAIIHGPCLVKEYAVVGMGSIVSNGCEIGNESLLAAGSVLPPRSTIPPRKLAMGNPALVVKDLSEKMISKNKNGLKLYQDMAKRCINELKIIVD
ncbi:MAG: phenylacetic acid degradation protein PaaY [Firmicutes bacterium HGW-Firmicutes-15]|nr:MAG: phenylacetic acid degradation protein PaaY [Firmicutes bacterium HGW-Firmicutes-15]